MKNFISLLLVLSLSLIFISGEFNVAHAASLSSASATLSTPAASASSVTYTINFSGVTVSTIKCINVRLTTVLGSNSKPTGMIITSAALDAASDFIPTPGYWGISNNNTTGVSSITYATGEAPASASNRTVVLTGITNGSTANTTYFAEVDTFNNIDCASSGVDSGDTTFAYTTGVTVSATVNPTLTFTVDSTTCSLGVLTTSATGSCSHTMTAATNGTSGYTISYIAGDTLTNADSDTISAIGGTKAASSTSNEQFGINLKDNATPNVGAEASGGSGAASANYDTADQFAFNTAGASIASVAGPSAVTTFTASMIANVASTTEAGAYSTTVTYNITATY